MDVKSSSVSTMLLMRQLSETRSHALQQPVGPCQSMKRETLEYEWSLSKRPTVSHCVGAGLLNSNIFQLAQQ
jgi:hypothetical protein